MSAFNLLADTRVVGRQPSSGSRRFYHTDLLGSTRADGVRWRVRELQPSERAAALYFETQGVFRRVNDYPSDWRDLPTGELEILSRGT